MVSVKLAYTLVIGLVSVASAMPQALDTSESMPEIIPGEGLPSLESLGWTSEYLYSLGQPESATDEMGIMADSGCGGRGYGNVTQAIGCYHYLKNLGQTMCSVPENKPDYKTFCSAGNIDVRGYGRGQASWCQDVAHAVLWTVDHCTRPEQTTSGWQAAYGNGGFRIDTGRS